MYSCKEIDFYNSGTEFLQIYIAGSLLSLLFEDMGRQAEFNSRGKVLFRPDVFLMQSSSKYKS